MSSTGTRTYTLGAREVAMRETRARILESANELWSSRWYADVTLADIAAGAGVSVQTVVNHFGCKDGLVAATTEWMRPQIEAAREVAPGNPAEAVRVLFDHYEGIGDAVIRWDVEAEWVPAIRDVVREGREVHRSWLAHVFADRLPARGAARERALDLYYAATDVHVWKLWRRDFGLSRADAERRMRDLVAALGTTASGR